MRKNRVICSSRHTLNREIKATYHSKFVLVQVTIFINITEIPDLQQLPQTQRFRGRGTLSAFDVNCHHIKRTPEDSEQIFVKNLLMILHLAELSPMKRTGSAM